MQSEAGFPDQKHLKQYLYVGQMMDLQGLKIKTVPNNAFQKFPNITVSIPRLDMELC